MFFLVIMPLITSGVIVKLLAMVGIRLPKGIFGGLAGAGGRHGFDGGFPAGGFGGGSGVQESVNGLMNIAKMFM